MALSSSGSRKPSFEILTENKYLEGGSRSSIYQSGPAPPSSPNGGNPSRQKRKMKKHKRKKDSTTEYPITAEDAVVKHRRSSGGNVSAVWNLGNNGIRDNGNVNRISYVGGASVVVLEDSSVCQNVGGFGELRQRNVNGAVAGGGDEMETTVAKAGESGGEVSSSKEPFPSVLLQPMANGNVVNTFQTAASWDWKRVIAEDPNYVYTVGKSPMKYFLEEMHHGNSLRNTTTLGSEKERERVYDTIFRLPWRCEVCSDIISANICRLLHLLRFISVLVNYHAGKGFDYGLEAPDYKFKWPSAAELCDFGCFLVLACGVIVLGQTDISLIYHMIRGQATIKLYVVYNVWEIFDKLCQSFGGDVLETLFNSAEGLANCSQENMRFWIRRFVSDQALAMAFSNIFMFKPSQAITLSTCIVARNNALFALLVSNNFAEIKSNVFKRFSKDNIHSLAYSGALPFAHIFLRKLFVPVKVILIVMRHESMLWPMAMDAFVVFVCEILIDIIKHSFLAKFNDIKPIAYSEFLEDLCKQTLNIQTEDCKKNLTFVPLAPACVVIRVLTPVYAAHLPCSPLAWRFFWILVLISMTYIMLTSLKVMVGVGLQKHATWELVYI
ncbi:Protein POLLEN DEFECTIVE IN GUIDANCE 1 [Hibiscus syriacus]|uniref:Protein POLLEN DEFECTIVE IN GUIDANCE 1 n=1 Tax=Hibiscus syriacus TaxID=106335 RepID=A0A6A3BG76_HIBSY|nr:Protein POLLEN DEFECTIVE IN GUIDANCE 1 [Hibiscus syriacus]